MIPYLAWREPGQLGAVLGQWRPSAWVGLTGVTASACWFTAMTIQNAAYVRAVGQIELIFTFLVSVVFFREKVSRTEIIGVILLSGAIVLLVLEKAP